MTQVRPLIAADLAPWAGLLAVCFDRLADDAIAALRASGAI